MLGPWLPKHVIVAEALGIDRANPLRGRIPATEIPSAWNGTSGGAYDDPRMVRFFSGDPQLGLVYVPTGNTSPDYYGGQREGLDYYSS